MNRAKSKKVYTEKIHAKRLLLLLEKRDPCGCCPKRAGSMDFSMGDALYPTDDSIFSKKICKICAAFVSAAFVSSTFYRCPCCILGPKEAVKRSWIALEEGGYLD